MTSKVNKHGAISLTKEDRDEVLKLVNILSETLSKLQFTHNETEKSYHEKYRLKEPEAVELEMSR
jgi:hypothetical protein